MKRRVFVQSLAAVPALTPQQPQRSSPSNNSVEVNLETAQPDAVAQPVHRFFTTDQFAALHRVSDLLEPASATAPGAIEAGTPEFLDFLLSESPEERQQLYLSGLDGLNAASVKRYHKPFAATDASEAHALLSPLRQPWSYTPPADPVTRFLLAAKQDVRTATINSQPYVAAGAATGRRGRGGSGIYWYPLD